MYSTRKTVLWVCLVVVAILCMAQQVGPILQTTTFTRQWLRTATDAAEARSALGVSDSTDFEEALPNLGLGYFGGEDTTNTARNYFSKIGVEGPPTTRMDYYEGGSVLLDTFAPGFRVVATNDTLSLGYNNLPDTTGRIAMWPLSVSNAFTEITTPAFGDATPVSLVSLDTLGPGEYALYTLISEENVLRYVYVGPQTNIMQEEVGGNATPNGEAVAGRSTLYYPVPYSGTNYDAELHRGREAEIQANDDVHFAASAQRPANTNLVRWTYYDIIADGVDVNLSARTDWVLDGWTNNTTISNGMTFSLLVKAKGPSETNVWAYNRKATTTILGGGGSPPASTLNDVLAAYKFEATSGSVVDNVEGTAALDLTEMNGAWTKSFPGVDGLSWTNTGTTQILTNDAAALELGRGGASFSISYWIAPNTTAIANVLGEANASADYGWLARTASDNGLAFRISANGSTLTIASGAGIVTAGQWNHVCMVFDNDANLIKLAVGGVPFVTLAFTGDVFDSVAGFSVGGTSSSGTISGIRGAFDEVYVWNRALTESEKDELAAGKFCDGSGVFPP